MAESLSIIIRQHYEHGKIFGVPIPFTRYVVTDATYQFENNGRSGETSACDSVAGLAYLLVNIGAEKDVRQIDQIGPINVTFDSILDNGTSPMAKLLGMYARSEKATLTFEHK